MKTYSQMTKEQKINWNEHLIAKNQHWLKKYWEMEDELLELRKHAKNYGKSIIDNELCSLELEIKRVEEVIDDCEIELKRLGVDY